MNKEQFIALGFTEEQADKAATASQEELKGFVPKTRFDEVNEAKKTAEKDVADRDKQIDDLSKTAGLSEDLKKQIETLKTENQTAKEKYESDLQEVKISNAISAALAGKVHNEKVVTGLIDKTKLVLGDDGKIVGLDEQLTGLKTSDAYLFKEEENKETGGGAGGFKLGGGGNPNPPGAALSLKDAISSHFQNK